MLGEAIGERAREGTGLVGWRGSFDSAAKDVLCPWLIATEVFVRLTFSGIPSTRQEYTR